VARRVSGWAKLVAVPAESPEDPTTAGVPRTRGETRRYDRDELAVLWDATLCTHVAACIKALPAVFDPGRRPWVAVDAASADAIAEAIQQCPTGALRYEAKGDFPPEPRPSPATVDIRPTGPLLVRGDVTVTRPPRQVITDSPRVALCRCGRTGNAPFCDNSHRLP
jgi:uncharacterized Fe-S cluster protein YjdI